MPFTPGHAAIVLPFIRLRWLSATGLIIGSFSPDFEYFFKMSVSSNYSHTRAGLFYFDLPVTIFLAFLFHQVVKKNLIINLPPFFQRRFQDTLQLDFVQYAKGNWLILILSSLAGAASHIFWDSFTHNSRYFVRMFSDFYQNNSVFFDGVSYPMFYVMQQVSTAVGCTAVILYALLKRPVEDAVVNVPRIAYWLAVIAIAMVAFVVRFWIYSDDAYMIGNLVVTAISGLLLGTIICGFINFKNKVYQQTDLNG